MPSKTNAIVTVEQQAALQSQMRLIVRTFVLELIVSLSILAFNSYYIPTHGCAIMAHTEWLRLWPMNNNYIITLHQANFSERDICVMVSTLSLASVVCIVATVLTIVRIIIRKSTVYFKNTTPTVIVVLAGTTWYLSSGIFSNHTLFAPSEDKSIVINSIFILTMMAGWFFMLTFVVDRVRSSIAHAIANH
ncbi:MAG: hypothetical protein ABSF49_12650 [Roseiarcus sp.]|jgi:hypothetical protein|uniref:hypothetical protein n=1 Tax=Roseiarcus sp. TaxID=1969460 RepID=UPI003C1AADDA